ncbi:MAG TPA: AAA family ATPase [Oligoflexia bacterium]|nr:AAA family ATPase [Oligoflexia bacterium]HMP48651.1 AAA family ATPase [Oligoflexia bacterium]
MKRYLSEIIAKDLERKMVFLTGPRQVGKTTLALSYLKNQEAYLNWDTDEGRASILDKKFASSELLIFDEIHKYRKWRNYLKGICDSLSYNQKILVTGSAKLEWYRFGGDSLQGRYLMYRLHPLTVAELGINADSDFQQLLTLGGFPEPFFSGSEDEARRWSRLYRTRLVREDLATLEDLKDLGTVELLASRLPDLVGSPLSINALREDLQVAHQTVSKWLLSLERTYAFFRLLPFGSPKLKAVKKEQKHYHFDWSIVPQKGPRFENLLAVHLLKWCQYQEDSRGIDIELRYFRDVTGREIDFIITVDKKPTLAIEAKYDDSVLSPTLKYFKNRFPECSTIQLTAVDNKDYISGDGIKLMWAPRFLQTLI